MPDNHSTRNRRTLKVQHFDQIRTAGVCTVLFLTVLSCGPAGETDKAVTGFSEVANVMKSLDDHQQRATLYYALDLSDPNPTSELREIWSGFSESERQEILAFAQNPDAMAPSFYLEKASAFQSSSKVQRIGENSKQKPARTRDSEEGPFAEMAFASTEHDFGRILDTEVLRYGFSFRNTGDVPLLIEEVTGTCGCTSPFWTKEPVAPGESGTIEVTYNPEGKSGRERQPITVIANTPTTPIRLFVVAEVVSAEK